MRILLVEDDAGIGSAVREHLVAEAHAVDWARRLAEARRFLPAADYELVLLDLILPDGNGLELLREIRGRALALPVIILSARDQISQRIEGLNAGADDYLVKPFDLDELLARIAAVSRRAAGKPDSAVRLGDCEIDLSARRSRRQAKNLHLTAREWALLDALLRRPGATVSKATLEQCLYSFDTSIDSNALEVHVSRLRKKLGRDAIQTVRGVGYRAAMP